VKDSVIATKTQFAKIYSHYIVTTLKVCMHSRTLKKKVFVVIQSDFAIRFESGSKPSISP
jgi:hypothetical protein